MNYFLLLLSFLPSPPSPLSCLVSWVVVPGIRYLIVQELERIAGEAEPDGLAYRHVYSIQLVADIMVNFFLAWWTLQLKTNNG